MNKKVYLYLTVVFFINFSWRAYDRIQSKKVAAKLKPSIQKLAPNIGARELFMYSQENCEACEEAKLWLTQNNFQFSECFVDKDKACENAFLNSGGEVTPLLIFSRNGKSTIVSQGFDPEEFISGLSRSPASVK